MLPSKGRGPRVIYVAGSARELPQEVRDWLGQAGNRAAASPNVYDALALLAAGREPVAIVVNIDAVDWSEFDFFDHAARLSRETRIYVAGHEHQQAKVEAACARGAQVFTPEALSEDLDTTSATAAAAGPGGLLAGSLRSVYPQPQGTPERSAPPEAGETDEPPEEDRPPERPPVRLVTAGEPEDGDEAPVSIPVPWAPSPDRPKRTPPKAPSRERNRRGRFLAGPQRMPADAGTHADETRAAPPAPPATGAVPPLSPVELTPEELAALLGRSAPPDAGSVKEQRP